MKAGEFGLVEQRLPKKRRKCGLIIVDIIVGMVGGYSWKVEGIIGGLGLG